jgi:hypothetical protein
MKVPFSGGCACGAIRYECSSEPLAMLNCHCRDCQQSSGAPFASGVVVATSAIKAMGAPKNHTVRASSGALTTPKFLLRLRQPFVHQRRGHARFHLHTLHKL